LSKKDYKITTPSFELFDNIDEGVGESVLNEIIGCEHKGECKEQCTVAFKVTPRELEFYKTEKIPLPRLCPNCRHYQRLKKNNPIKFYHRQCMCDRKLDIGGKKLDDGYQNTVIHFHGDRPCPNEFETSYAPNRLEIVYCGDCYNSEVV